MVHEGGCARAPEIFRDRRAGATQQRVDHPEDEIRWFNAEPSTNWVAGYREYRKRRLRIS